jgi:hypothetical protein
MLRFVDHSLPPLGEESSHSESEQLQDAEETHLSNVRQLVITGMCPVFPLDTY